MNEIAVRFLVNWLPISIIVFYVLAAIAGIVHLRNQFRRQALSANELLLWVLFVIAVPFGGFIVLILFSSRGRQKRG